MPSSSPKRPCFIPRNREDIPVKYFLKTFGCRVNQYETEALREGLVSDGDVLTDDFEAADLCVLNTCSVTGEADRDALTLLRRISRRNPAARIVVTGCLATRAEREVLEAAPSAIVVPNREKDSIPGLLGCAPRPGGLERFHGHARAFVKVQDGCDMGCTYCIVPSVRPELWSKPLEALEEECRGLIAAGVPELVLCGIRLGRWRSGTLSLPDLIARLCRLPGDFRLRLSSLEVSDVSARFLKAAAEAEEKFCPSFHLPVQSGSDAVLKRMGRWYNAGYFERRVEALRGVFPGAGLFTDVLAGFPGETEKEFQETLDLLSRVGFSGLHAFRYSRRPGTPAAGLEGQLPESVLSGRAGALRTLDRRLRTAFASAAAGSVRRAVVEERSPRVTATTDHFLRLTLDRDPGPGLCWVEVGPAARGRVQHIPIQR